MPVRMDGFETVNCGVKRNPFARRRVVRHSRTAIKIQEVYANVPYLSAQEASALQGARLPQENENRQRPEGAFPPSCQGPRSPDPLRPRSLHREKIVKGDGEDFCLPRPFDFV